MLCTFGSRVAGMIVVDLKQKGTAARVRERLKMSVATLLISSEEIAFCSDAESSPHTCSHLCSADAVGVFSDMKSCSILHSVQCLLILRFNIVSALSFTTVKAKLHQSVDLTCEQKCPGSLKWIVDYQPDDALAQCDQTSCSSKEGYQISYDQYSKGYISLTIMEADYTKRSFYACECNAEDLCHVWVCIEPVSSSVQLKPGEDLILVLPIPGPVEVIYNTSDSSGPCCELICTVVGGSLHCEDAYSLRVSLRYPNLTLEAVNVSDNGVYIVRDRKHNEDLHVYNVSVEDTNIKQTSAPPEELIVGLVVLLVGAAGLISVYLTRTTVLVNNTCAIEKEEHAERERERDTAS
ncbi:uncharacterized protein LOC128610601 isoform X2 [Ictalurus furcatus]|uniref:uncharacterized protein LOC128610601 isoform X2 n=1 Tax=Ictalurus furcatus TaxID=66913 RepID=UPI0023509EE8|nr:uncharacterized protein LOC128610601 isoform X2 [Ictalurus furcatus]